MKIYKFKSLEQIEDISFRFSFLYQIAENTVNIDDIKESYFILWYKGEVDISIGEYTINLNSNTLNYYVFELDKFLQKSISITGRSSTSIISSLETFNQEDACLEGVLKRFEYELNNYAFILETKEVKFKSNAIHWGDEKIPKVDSIIEIEYNNKKY